MTMHPDLSVEANRMARLMNAWSSQLFASHKDLSENVDLLSRYSWPGGKGKAIIYEKEKLLLQDFRRMIVISILWLSWCSGAPLWFRHVRSISIWPKQVYRGSADIVRQKKLGSTSHVQDFPFVLRNRPAICHYQQFLDYWRIANVPMSSCNDCTHIYHSFFGGGRWLWVLVNNNWFFSQIHDHDFYKGVGVFSERDSASRNKSYVTETAHTIHTRNRTKFVEKKITKNIKTDDLV